MKECVVKKSVIVNTLLGHLSDYTPSQSSVTVYAPTNIALCKYWGKRNQELNLPVTSSLSISLADKGAETTLSLSTVDHDVFRLNGKLVDASTSFHQRLLVYLDLFRPYAEFYFAVDIVSTVPIAAGLASSACGFAAMALALDKFFSWKLSLQQLSIIARLGSGSACRSLWQGFVEWHVGERADGMDSFGEPLSVQWPELNVGLMMLSEQEKSISSREAMLRTVQTSELYKAWPGKVEHDLRMIKQAIYEHDFDLLGKTAESNALAMHATMLSAWPPISYCLPETINAMRRVWQARADGLSVYFTQDAGPNLKLLFLQKDKDVVQELMFLPSRDCSEISPQNLIP
jgi:diphosphomevalonate decarboxylase